MIIIMYNRKANTWQLPLPPLSSENIEPVSSTLDPGDSSAREEAAFKIIKNYNAITKFSLRGCGSPGKKQFQVNVDYYTKVVVFVFVLLNYYYYYYYFFHCYYYCYYCCCCL